MNICILATTIPPIMGGLEVHVWELARHLIKKGHQVCLIGYLRYKGATYRESEKKDGVKIYRVHNNYIFGGYTTYIFNAAKKVVTLNRKFNFDIIHAHQAYPAGLAAKIASARVKIPYIITSHGQEIIILGKSLRFKPLLWLALRNARKVIAVSNELAKLSVKYGAEKERSIVLSNVVDIERFNSDINGSEVRDKYKISRDKIVILSLRRLEPKTGVQYLIEAAKKVISQFSNVYFLIVGGGQLKEELIRKTNEYNIAVHFIFTGSVDNQNIPSYIAASDFSVFPSLAEATSIACLEVMACGKPVIVSNVGGLPEIVTDNINGLIVDFERKDSTYTDYGLSQRSIDYLAKAMLELCNDRDLRFKLGLNARKIVKENYSWEKYIEKLENIYQGAINEDRTPKYSVSSH